MILLIGLLIFSAFFTASEMAFLGCDWIKLKNQADKQANIRRTGTKIALKWLHNQDNFLSALLVGNNLTNIAISLIAKEYWRNKLSDGVIVLICTITIFIFGEIFPKSLVSRFKEKFFVIISPVYIVLYWVFYPFIFLSYQTSMGILKLFKSKSSPIKKQFSREEFRMATKKFFSLREQGFILRLFEFEDKAVRDIMLPRNKVVAMNVGSTIQEIQQVVSKTGHSRIPLYEGTLDNILGYIVAKDLLTAKDINKIIRECKFIQDNKKINELFDDLKSDSKDLIIVKNATGKTAGIITFEDIIEELFGEIEDEYKKIG